MTLLPRLLLTALLALPLVSRADEPLFVQVPAILDPSAVMPEAVRQECGVQALVADGVLAALEGGKIQVKKVAAAAEAGQAEFLQVSVLGANGYGGGTWSGPKSMTIRVDLRKGESLLGMTVLSRSTKGGALSGFSGTCSLLERVAGALGKDTARWLVRTREKGALPAPAAASIAPAAELPASAQ